MVGRMLVENKKKEQKEKQEEENSWLIVEQIDGWMEMVLSSLSKSGLLPHLPWLHLLKHNSPALFCVGVTGPDLMLVGLATNLFLLTLSPQLCAILQFLSFSLSFPQGTSSILFLIESSCGCLTLRITKELVFANG
jgi:hypothetical protein